MDMFGSINIPSTLSCYIDDDDCVITEFLV